MRQPGRLRCFRSCMTSCSVVTLKADLFCFLNWYVISCSDIAPKKKSLFSYFLFPPSPERHKAAPGKVCLPVTSGSWFGFAWWCRYGFRWCGYGWCYGFCNVPWCNLLCLGNRQHPMCRPENAEEPLGSPNCFQGMINNLIGHAGIDQY